MDKVQDEAAVPLPIPTMVKPAHDLDQSRKYPLASLPLGDPGLHMREGEHNLHVIPGIEIDKRLVPFFQKDHPVSPHDKATPQRGASVKQPRKTRVQLGAPARNIEGIDGIGAEDLDALLHHFCRHRLSPLGTCFHMAVPAFQITPVPDVDLEYIDGFGPHLA
jgi:hypothetical protein